MKKDIVDAAAWSWLNENELSYDIWNRKYRYHGESFEDWLDRVSGENSKYKKLILDKKFLPAGRILSNRGLHKDGKKVTYSNCYVGEPPEDNIESIFDCAKQIARTFSYGGGIGIDISKLSPRGAKINNTAEETTGSVSFMELYSAVTGLIGQRGRRGALMISIDCNHPDLEEFIDIKTDLGKITKANISVKITDGFMEAVKNGDQYELSFIRDETGEEIKKVVDARKIFHKLCKANWGYAEPGMLFWDNIKNWNLLSNNKEFEYAGVNPCFSGDMELLTTEGYKTFESLCGTEPYIYNVNGNITKSKIWCSGEKDTVRVEVVGKRDIICTPEHIFMTADGDECVAKDLKSKYIMPNDGSELFVRDVKPNGIMKVYDFTEPETHWGIVEGCVVHNCAEEPLPAGGSCLLGSINLSEFVIDPFTDGAEIDFAGLEITVRDAVEFLNEILDEGIPLHPLEVQRRTVSDWRQIGLGIFGLSDMLIKLGIKYGSNEAVRVCGIIADDIAQTALLTSANLAAKYGAYPKFDLSVIDTDFFGAHSTQMLENKVRQNGLRNSQLLTIAPTGTLSTMLGVSGGIEPIFANSYIRRTESLHNETVSYKVYTPIVEEFMRTTGIKNEDDLPYYFVTSKDISPTARIDMQAAFQDHIDASISSTINLPNESTINDVERIYMYAWEKKLKGVTVYRAGCVREGILVEDNDAKAEQILPIENSAYEEYVPRGYVIDVSDDLIGTKRKLVTGCGSIHFEVYSDQITGEPQETFINIGSSGGYLS